MVFIYNNMQWKPIANKYRKGTMKSTLHSTHATHSVILLRYALQHASSKGSERESEIALQRINKITFVYNTESARIASSVIYIYTDRLLALSLISNFYTFQRSTIGQSAFASIR